MTKPPKLYPHETKITATGDTLVTYQSFHADPVFSPYYKIIEKDGTEHIYLDSASHEYRRIYDRINKDKD
jgi:hypothetical protein